MVSGGGPVLTELGFLTAEMFGTLFVVRKTDPVNLELVKLVLYA